MWSIFHLFADWKEEEKWSFQSSILFIFPFLKNSSKLISYKCCWPVSQHKEISKITAEALFFLPSRAVFSFINYLFLLDRLPSDFMPSTFPCLFLKAEVVCCLFNIHCPWDYFWAQNAKLFLRLHFHFQCFITSWVELHYTLTEAYITCGNVLVCCIVLHLV